MVEYFNEGSSCQIEPMRKKGDPQDSSKIPFGFVGRFSGSSWVVSGRGLAGSDSHCPGKQQYGSHCP